MSARARESAGNALEHRVGISNGFPLDGVGPLLTPGQNVWPKCGSRVLQDRKNCEINCKIDGDTKQEDVFV